MCVDFMVLVLCRDGMCPTPDLELQCPSLTFAVFFCKRGRTLEELNDVFNQPWPARASARKVKVAVKETAPGDVEVVDAK